MGTLDAKDAVEHYQMQMPMLKSEFAKKLAHIRFEHQRSGSLFSKQYIDAVSRATLEEVRTRMNLAESSLRDALDAGWFPSEDQLRQSFTDCFNPSDHLYNSFDDLNQDALHEITTNLGRPPDPSFDILFRRNIGQAQVESSKKSNAALKMYLRKKAASAEMQGDFRPTGSNQESMRIDETQVGILEYVEAHPDPTPSFGSIAHSLGIDPAIAIDELTLMGNSGLLRTVHAPGGLPILESRVFLAENGRAALAARRKRIREGSSSPSTAERGQVSEMDSKRVFLTHGRDRPTRDAVATFLYGLGLQPVVLEEQANAGLTIIEKYEKHSHVAYGIAILSPDDMGCEKEKWPDAGRPRARQNVIFELGFMFASISRHRVAVLLTDSQIESPTNIDGIVWIPMDEHGGWKHNLTRELREAGLLVRE